MKPKPPATATAAAATLRRHAEGQLRVRQKQQKSEVKNQKLPTDPQRTLHELQVHQIELLMQNTELHEARDQLEVQLEKYTDLYDFAPVGYFSLDEQGVVLEANLTGSALLGVERSRIINRRLSRFVSPANQSDLLAFLKQVFDGTGKKDCDMAMVKADGTPFWARFRGTSALSVSDARNWCRVSVSDITSLKQAEEILLRNEVLFSALIQQAPMGVYVVDDQFRLSQVNPKALPHFGKIHPLIGRDFSEVTHIVWPKKIADEVVAHFQHTLQTGKTYVSTDFSGQRLDSGVAEAYEWQVQRIRLPAGHHGAVCFFHNVTERKQAEEALRDSEERYRTLFNSMNEGFCVIEMIFDKNKKVVDYRFLEINPAFEKKTGLKDARGKRIRELAPQHEQYWFDIYGKVALTGKSVCFHHQSEVLQRLYEGYAFRVQMPASHRVGIIFNDVTARKKAEETLRASEERFRALVTASSDVVYRMNPDWSEMGQLDGRNFVTSTQAPSRTWFTDNIHPDDQPHLRAVIDEAIRTKSVFELEHRVRRVDGTWGWTFSRAIPLLAAQGEIIEWFGAASDITQRKAAEEKLRESEERFRVAALAMSNLIWTNNAQGKMEGEQPGWAQFTGQTPKEYTGYGWARAVHPDDAQPTIEVWNAAVAEKRPFEFEHRVRRHDGAWRLCSVRAVPVFGKDGEIREWVGVHNDITERKKAEETQRRVEVLAASNQKLELEIIRRQAVEKALKKSERHSSQLLARARQQEEQLRQLARQILLAQEEERKRISRELHDEIAQTLVGMNVHLESLVREGTVNAADFKQKIVHTQQLIESSVNVVHRFARDLRPTLLDDLGLIPALHSYLKEFTERTKVRIHFKAFAGVERLSSDRRTVLYRVTQSALTNIAQHAHATEVKVNITKVRHLACLEIHDNGQSFDVEQVLFAKRYKRLGLIGTRERVEMIGGTFSVESSPGKGTTIRTQIPYSPPGKSRKDSLKTEPA